jgi:hypothetical protein
MKTFLIALLFFQSAHAAYLVKQRVLESSLGKRVEIESVQKINLKVNQKKTLKNIREFIAEKEQTDSTLYQELLYPEDELPAKYLLKIENSEKSKRTDFFSDSEVKELVKKGPDQNRITITILGDGYTLAEKEKYFNDVNRIVSDLFKEVTFKSYLPLFNIYAVFVASKESGITDTTQRDTAFGLYRSPKNSKRGIIPGNRIAIERALNLIPANTDYPIIIANDDYYGGLGGRYAITTRSLDSGSMVLRHELGHNFSNVGEEYDGGQVYSGANFSSSQKVSWHHWVKGKMEVHEAKFLTGAYLWQDLGKKDYKEKFDFPSSGDYTFDLNISSVGWSSANDVKVYLDNEELVLDGVFTRDRSFFTTKRVAINDGEHHIKIEDHNHDGDNVLAFANGYAYPKSYDFTPAKIGAFNVFDSSGIQRGYRPTHNQCLMRDMRSKVFCPIDQENIWLRFLDRVSLIDDVIEKGNIHTLTTLELEGLSIKWYKKSLFSKKEIKELANKKEINLRQYGKGKYVVEVTFASPEIKKSNDVTVDTQEITIN